MTKNFLIWFERKLPVNLTLFNEHVHLHPSLFSLRMDKYIHDVSTAQREKTLKSLTRGRKTGIIL